MRLFETPRLGGRFAAPQFPFIDEKGHVMKTRMLMFAAVSVAAAAVLASTPLEAGAAGARPHSSGSHRGQGAPVIAAALKELPPLRG